MIIKGLKQFKDFVLMRNKQHFGLFFLNINFNFKKYIAIEFDRNINYKNEIKGKWL